MDFAKLQTNVLSPPFAAALSIFFTVLYVIPFYLSSKTRPSPQQARDDPGLIRARIRSVTFSCLLICLITALVCSNYGGLTGSELIRIFGLWPVDLNDIARSLALTALLFLGPLVGRTIIDGRWRSWITGVALTETFSDIAGWRTFVAGPISEELVWRSMIIALHLAANVNATKIVFVTPLYFGIAHIHHCYEFKVLQPHTPLAIAILRSLFQFTYTSLFGFYAAFIFLRTGNLLAAILAHSFCNWMGLPRFWGRIYSEESGRIHILWTIGYYTLLILGSYSFYLNLFSLTYSRNALVPRWPQ